MPRYSRNVARFPAVLFQVFEAALERGTLEIPFASEDEAAKKRQLIYGFLGSLRQTKGYEKTYERFARIKVRWPVEEPEILILEDRNADPGLAPFHSALGAANLPNPEPDPEPESPPAPESIPGYEPRLSEAPGLDSDMELDKILNDLYHSED